MDAIFTLGVHQPKIVFLVTKSRSKHRHPLSIVFSVRTQWYKFKQVIESQKKDTDKCPFYCNAFVKYHLWIINDYWLTNLNYFVSHYFITWKVHIKEISHYFLLVFQIKKSIPNRKCFFTQHPESEMLSYFLRFFLLIRAKL